MTPRSPLPRAEGCSHSPPPMPERETTPRPRKATVSDYDDLIRFLNGIFGIRMDLQYSHIYKRTQKDMSNNILLRDGNRITSCVGIFPMTLVCGDARLSVGGIGGVSTDPNFRGQGLMTMLLNTSIAVMQRRNYDLSILWGDRHRYNQFGWENAGRQYAFKIDRRHVSNGKAIGAEIRPFSNSRADLHEIAQVHEGRERRVLRTRAQLKSVLNRHTYESWVWRNRRAFAYITIKGEAKDRELIEFGGSLSGLDDLLRFLFEKYQLESLRGTMAVSQSPYLRFIIDRSTEWGIRFIGMVKILNLKSVLQKFAPQLGSRCGSQGLKGELTLEMTNSAQVATLHLGNQVTVDDRKRDPNIRLSDTEMVRLILGTIPPSQALALDTSLGYLDALFPLDFYIGRLDYV